MKLYTPNTGEYNLVMAYPAIESFALSSLGYMWLYKLADTCDGIADINAFQGGTAIECSVSDARDGVGEDDSFDHVIACKRFPKEIHAPL